MSPCHKCGAKCCRYFALQLDTPRSRADFENIRWYLAHKKVTIFVDGGKWFLDVGNECRYLTADHRCRIYDKRPLVCREHDTYECERHPGDFGHEHTFKKLEELDRYIEKRFKSKRKRRK